MEKSAWLIPAQFGVSIEYCNAIVCGSRKSSRLRASATTIADFPPGVKHMLYGSSTEIGPAGLPVLRSIRVRVPAARRAALFDTQSGFRSYGGTPRRAVSP